MHWFAIVNRWGGRFLSFFYGSYLYDMLTKNRLSYAPAPGRGPKPPPRALGSSYAAFRSAFSAAFVMKATAF